MVTWVEVLADTPATQSLSEALPARGGQDGTRCPSPTRVLCAPLAQHRLVAVGLDAALLPHWPPVFEVLGSC